MIVVPERYSYIEAYLTLRCNFTCKYCINSHTGVTRKRKELTAKQWCAGLNRLQTKLPVTLGGGEPTIHKEFYEILNGLALKVDLLTNGMAFDIDEFIEKTKPEMFYYPNCDHYKSIRVSYHPKSTDPDKVIERVRILQDAGYHIGIFGLNHPENLQHNVIMTEKCRKSGVYFFIRDFLGYYGDMLYGYYKYRFALNGNRKNVKCRSEDFIIDPNGKVFRCHRDLYADGEPIGSILDISYEVNEDFIECSNCGLCSPCDAKLKLGSDLITSKCSIEIIE